MREEIVAHVAFVVGGRFDIDERARQLENMHSEKIVSGRSGRKEEPRRKIEVAASQ
jgi:hypothetical protein